MQSVSRTYLVARRSAAWWLAVAGHIVLYKRIYTIALKSISCYIEVLCCILSYTYRYITALTLKISVAIIIVFSPCRFLLAFTNVNKKNTMLL